MDTNPQNQKPKVRGGPDYHKPGCGCPACKARRRKAEALANGTGTETSSSKAITDIVYTPLRTTRGRVADWVRMKSEDPGLTNIEIAKRLGITPGTLAGMITRGRKEGWLKFEDPVNQLQYEVIPKATENIVHYLDQKDKQVTLAVLNSLIAPTYKDAMGIKDTEVNNVIALKIEMPPADQMPIVKGQIVGKGRQFTIDAEKVDEDS